MIINFNYNQFENYYKNLPIIQNPINMIVFSKDYQTISGFTNYKWISKPVISNIIHPYLNNLYISFTKDYIFFYLPIQIGGIYYGNHFSFGKKQNSNLIDMHYTFQDVLTQQSFNDSNKCFLFENKQIDTENIYEMQCERPKNKELQEVFNSLFIDYISIIILSPIIIIKKDITKIIKPIIKRIKSANSKINAPIPSP